MIDYIKREAAVNDAIEHDDGTPWSFSDVIAMLHHVPAADVVEVVRCEDCKYYRTKQFNGLDGKKFEAMICHRFGLAFKSNDYCSYGERRLTSHAVSAGRRK